MNMIVLVGMAGTAGASPVWADSCAVALFVAGGLSLAIAGYLLYKAPKFHSVREVSRR